MAHDLDDEELKATRILHGVAKEEIEEIELREDDIQVITTFDVWVNCPKCGKEYYEPDVDYETEYICECEECGHKFKFDTGSPY